MAEESEEFDGEGEGAGEARLRTAVKEGGEGGGVDEPCLTIAAKEGEAGGVAGAGMVVAMVFGWFWM